MAVTFVRPGHNDMCSEGVQLPVLVCLCSGSNGATGVDGQ